MLCPNAKKCSGCQLQNMEYDEQLRYKQARVVKLLGRFCRIEDIVPAPNPTHYRNKVQTAFGFRRGSIVSGVYQSSTGAIVPTDECLLENKKASAITVTVRRLCESFKIHAYDNRTGKGFLRHVLVRIGIKTSQIMVVLVTSKGEFKSKNAFLSELLKRHPEITTVVHNVNDTDKGLMLGQKSEVLYGDGYITESLCGLSFRISPKAFFQVNSDQTERLYMTAKAYADLTGSERVIDAYCGTGTIGLCLADGAKEVFGVELNRDAVSDAKANADANGIANVRFFSADAGDFMASLANENETADVVITDPPRAGCSAKFLKNLLALSPERVVYISCNPETLARDLYTFRNGGYKVKKIQPVDMFPYTDHVETVVLLIKEKQ